ncbi:MAG: hypothetical protein GX627_00645 [Parcubacteria group bacterium]|jgi:hypothetical protein|nr:hypothetical protein [Parcubacteria group bacterium]
MDNDNEKLSLPIISAEAVQSFLAKLLGFITLAIGIGLFVYGLKSGTGDANIGFDGIAKSFAFMLSGIGVSVLASAFFLKI